MAKKIRKYTDEEKQYLKSIIPGRSYAEILVLFNAKFDNQLTKTNLAGFIKNNGVSRGIPSYFQKGHIPHNKGKPFLSGGRSAQTQFKKGGMPGNYRPIDSTRINVDGYTEIKVADPKKWRLLHRVIWEKEHGPVPKGHVVLFGDGDRTNISLENLLLVSRAELAMLCKFGLIGKSREITGVGIIAANLRLKLGKLQKKNKKRRKNIVDQEQ